MILNPTPIQLYWGKIHLVKGAGVCKGDLKQIITVKSGK